MTDKVLLICPACWVNTEHEFIEREPLSINPTEQEYLTTGKCTVCGNKTMNITK